MRVEEDENLESTDERRGQPALISVGELPFGAAVVAPRPGGSAAQDVLAAANQAARVAAVQRLDELLPGVDFEAMAQNVDDRRFAVVRVPDLLLERLDGPGTVDRLVQQEQSFGLGGVSFTRADREGHQPPPPHVARPAMRPEQGLGLLAVGGVAAALRDQWTMILNGADRYDATLSSLCTDVGLICGAHVNTNFYLAHGEAEGFGPHWDAHDTVIIQVQGRKAWSVFEPAVLSAQRPWIGREISDRPVWSGVLEPGTAIVIPRGWGHQVHDTDDLSIHYTVGINRMEVHHLFERIRFESGHWPSWRADVPFDLDDAAVSWGGSLFDETDGLSQAFRELVDDREVLQRALGIFRARIRRPTFSSLTDTFAALAGGNLLDACVEVAVPCGLQLVEEQGDHVVVAFDDRTVRIARPALDAFAELASGRARLVRELSPVPLDGLTAGDETTDLAGVDGREVLADQLLSLGVAQIRLAAPA